MVKQLELIPRPRVRLDEPARPRVRLDSAPMPRMPPNESVMEFPWEPELPDSFLARSGWSRNDEKPPLTGWWEVTDHRTGLLTARWWYDGDWSKGDPRDKMSTRLSHAQFVTQYAWRGLRQPHPDVYPCPPYVSTDLVLRAKAAGHSILTTYVRYKATAAGQGSAETMNAPQWPNGRPRVKL